MIICGLVLGMFGFIFGMTAWHKVSKLEAELKKRQILDEKFNSSEL